MVESRRDPPKRPLPIPGPVGSWNDPAQIIAWLQGEHDERIAQQAREIASQTVEITRLRLALTRISHASASMINGGDWQKGAMMLVAALNEARAIARAALEEKS